MTVTPLPIRPTWVRPPGARHGLTRQRTPGQPADPTALILTFEITLSGEGRYTDAAQVLDTLQRVTDRLCSARVAVTPAHSEAGPTTLSVAGPPDLPATDETEPESAGLIRIQPDSRDVWRHGECIAFTRVEFDLLLFLALHPHRVFTRGQLLQSVWGFAHAGQRTVDVHIRRLRAKLGDDLVTTVRGVGYRLGDEATLRVVRQR